jgi:hypothetical protein
VIPNLAAYITINEALVLFQQTPSLKRVVPVAVDRAIRDIIQPVVERSVTIGVMTTRELVNKDFAMEPDETKLRQGREDCSNVCNVVYRYCQGRCDCDYYTHTFSDILATFFRHSFGHLSAPQRPI